MLLESIKWEPGGCFHQLPNYSSPNGQHLSTSLCQDPVPAWRQTPEYSRSVINRSGGACVTLQTIQIWCKSIREGTFTPVKTPTPGRLRMTSSEAIVRRVKDILKLNPRMSAREIVDNLSLPRSTVHRILKAHLNFWTAYSVWVPRAISLDNKQQQILCWKDILKLFRTNACSFLGSHYLVQDESWIPWDS